MDKGRNVTMRTIACIVAVITTLSMAMAYIMPSSAYAADAGVTEVYRMYNRNSGEHFYTSNAAEKDALKAATWVYEGVAWTTDSTGSTPVYRLYNPNAGNHYYTVNAAERDALVRMGWRNEDVAFESGGDTAVYVAYNPNSPIGNHNYTTDTTEQNSLIGQGWTFGTQSFSVSGAGYATSESDASVTACQAENLKAVYKSIYDNDWEVFKANWKNEAYLHALDAYTNRYITDHGYKLGLLSVVHNDGTPGTPLSDREQAEFSWDTTYQLSYDRWVAIGKPANPTYEQVVTVPFEQEVQNRLSHMSC